MLGNLLFKEKINYVQSFLPLPNLINVACSVWAIKRRRIVISERASPRKLMQCSNWYLRTGYRLSIRYVYSLADHVIAISSGIKDELIGLGVEKKKISVIYNPLSIASGYENLTEHESKVIREKFFLCVGRHEYQKGIDVAIKAFKLLISNDDKLSKQIFDSGKKVEEKVWRMPLHKNYDKLMNSKNADMQNINYVGGAGSTTAAQFLQRFILNKTPWAHLDIAGMAFSKYGGALNSGGATGFGVRLLNQLIEENYE